MRNFLFSALFLLICLGATAQTEELTVERAQFFKEQEQLLQSQFDTMRAAPLKGERVKENAAFIPKLVNALKEEQSFLYPFDSLDGISVLYAPDNKFRIITWFIPMADTLPEFKKSRELENYGYRYYGAIQMNNPDKLELIPLVDKSDTIFTPEERILDSDLWYGAVYYNIIKKEHNGKTIYTLFGWDGNRSETSTKKLAEALTFENGKAIFGAPIFEFFRDDFYMKRNRFILEYKKASGVTMNYNEQKDMIVYDFIEPETPEAKGNYYMYIPDGTYEGLVFDDGIWRHEKKVFKGVSEKPLQLKGSNINEDSKDNTPKSKKKKKKKKKKRKNKKKKNL